MKVETKNQEFRAFILGLMRLNNNENFSYERLIDHIKKKRDEYNVSLVAAVDPVTIYRLQGNIISLDELLNIMVTPAKFLKE